MFWVVQNSTLYLLAFILPFLHQNFTPTFIEFRRCESWQYFKKRGMKHMQRCTQYIWWNPYGRWGVWMRNVPHKLTHLNIWFLRWGCFLQHYEAFRRYNLDEWCTSLSKDFMTLYYHPTSSSFSLLFIWGWKYDHYVSVFFNCLPWLCHKLWSLLLEPRAKINFIFYKLLLVIGLIATTKNSKYNG